jgi:hypothetical protein
MQFNFTKFLQDNNKNNIKLLLLLIYHKMSEMQCNKVNQSTISAGVYAKINEDVFAKLQTTGKGYSVLYFVNGVGDRVDIPTCFFVCDITDEDDQPYLTTILPGEQMFVLLWEHNYEMHYAGKKTTLIQDSRWAVSGNFAWTDN